MKVTFTEEAIAGMDPTRLGELIKHRVRIGARTIEVVTLDQAIGRLAAMGVSVIDVSTITTAIEVESTYPAPTPEELDDLCAKIGSTRYASEAVEVVETWTRERFGVVSAFTSKLEAEVALRNVETVKPAEEGVILALIDSGEATVVPMTTLDPATGEYPPRADVTARIAAMSDS